MRSIKFRAWDIKNKFMDEIDGQSLFVADGEIYECSHSYSGMVKAIVSDEYHLMQYIGRKDKNGVEIYEGDVLKSWYPCGTIIDSDLLVKFTPDIRASNGYRHVNWNDCEVVGNIYKNPELIGGEK